MATNSRLPVTTNNSNIISSGENETLSLTWSKPYPPVKRDGVVDDHDKPYFYYGHLESASIAELRNFLLPKTYQKYHGKHQGPNNFKLNSHKLAISGFTKTSKEQAFDYILMQLNKNTLRYVCVSNEIIPNDKNMPRLNIQIVLYKKKSIYTPFMDQFLDCKCEYQVTKYADAWNEYLKKGLNFIEHGFFEGSMDHGAKKVWFKVSRQKKTTNITAELASEAFALTKNNNYEAMCHLVKSAPNRCLSNLKGFDSNLEHFHKKKQFHENLKQAQNKEFCWPDSFPDCTEKLKNAMNEWLVKHFRKDGRPKCLFLIGPTGTGKTSFALSLPGIPNHCRGFWSSSNWYDAADYMILDDIPWNEFKNRGFPSHEDLLTGQKSVSANNKCTRIGTITVCMPAIVLLNPHRASDIRKLLDIKNKSDLACFWRERSFLYVMDKDEYFYKPKVEKAAQETTVYSVDNIPLFEAARRQWHKNQQTKMLTDNDDNDNQSELSDEYEFNC